MTRKTRALRIILLFVLVAAMALLALDATGIIDIDSWFGIQSKKNYVSYNTLSQAIDAKAVKEATIEKDRITFTTRDGTFVTDNPGSDSLRERLLVSGARTSAKDDASLSAILDILFDVIFFGAAGFGIYKLIEYNKKTFKVVHKTGVTFNDIAGMDAVKRDMMFLIDVLKNPQKYSGRGLRPVKGVILEGPPGNGKTLFAKALAQEADVNFIATKGADFQSAFMSMGGRKIKMLFNKASRNKPCIVFIDEFDSIGERRNYAGTGIDKENNRIITTMLNEMDGFSANNGLLVIAATNSFESLDSALIRPGRFDIKYTISNPDPATRKRLVEIYSKGKSFSADITEDLLVTAFDGLSCAAIEAILNEAQAICQQSNESEIRFESIMEAARKTGSKLNTRTRK